MTRRNPRHTSPHYPGIESLSMNAPAVPPTAPQPDETDTLRRFSGVRRLYGEADFSRFQSAHLAVIGIGGVGSWAAEALARSGVGRITLVDMDHIALSNVNRQLHALDGQLGRAKVGAMAERIRAINPACQVHEIDDFVTTDNLPELLGGGLDGVVDCIDQMRVKVAMAAWCHQAGLPLVVSGGAGGRTDPTRIAVADLARTQGDPLLARMRAELRRQHGFPREGRDFGTRAVYSSEALLRPEAQCGTGSEAQAGGGLNCTGYGSAVVVTASFGMAAAAQALAQLRVKTGTAQAAVTAANVAVLTHSPQEPAP